MNDLISIICYKNPRAALNWLRYLVGCRSFFGISNYKPTVVHEDSLDMTHLIDEQETWMGRYRSRMNRRQVTLLVGMSHTVNLLSKK